AFPNFGRCQRLRPTACARRANRVVTDLSLSRQGGQERAGLTVATRAVSTWPEHVAELKHRDLVVLDLMMTAGTHVAGARARIDATRSGPPRPAWSSVSTWPEHVAELKHGRHGRSVRHGKGVSTWPEHVAELKPCSSAFSPRPDSSVSTWPEHVAEL